MQCVGGDTVPTVTHDDSIPIFDNPNLHTVVWSPGDDLCAPYRCSMYVRCPPTGWRCFIGVVACTLSHCHAAVSHVCITVEGARVHIYSPIRSPDHTHIIPTVHRPATCCLEMPHVAPSHICRGAVSGLLSYFRAHSRARRGPHEAANDSGRQDR